MSEQGPGWAGSGGDFATAWNQPAPPSPPEAGAPQPPPSPFGTDGPGGGGSSPDLTDGDRPLPTIASLVGVVGGLLVVGGMFSLLSEVDGDEQRLVGLAISLLFTALGVALMILGKDRRAASAGVAIAAVAVVPLTGFAFASAGLFDFLTEGASGFESDPYDGLKSALTLLLLVAAILWGLAYAFAPSRRAPIFLGAALVAIWLIPMTQIGIGAIENASDSYFDATATFEPVPSDSGFSSDFDSGSELDDPFGQSQFDDQFEDDFEVDAPPDPTMKLGIVSLIFGALYLAGVVRFDRQGRRDTATPILAAAIPIVGVSIGMLSGQLGTYAGPILGLLFGAVGIVIGTAAGRRLTAWLGVLAVTIAVFDLVGRALQESGRALGLALTLVGLAIALAAGWFEGQHDGPAGPPTPF